MIILKKILFVVLFVMLVCSTAVFAAEGYFNAKFALDFSGVLSENDYSYDVDDGVTIAGEYLVPYNDSFDFGAGLAYQIERGLDEWDEEAKIRFIPLYGIAKYKIDQSYIVGQVGYNFFDGSDEYKLVWETEGGLYYGIGAGMNFSDDFFGEIIYSVNNGKLIDEEMEDIDVENSRVSLMLGYSF